MRTVLVLGGGVGGTVAANALRDVLDATDRVVLVDRQADQLFAPSLLWLMVGQRRPDRLQRPTKGLLRAGIEFVNSAVREVDPERRRVVTEDGELTGDAIVVALGAEQAPETSAGFSEIAHDFFTLEGASSFAAALRAFRGGRIAVAVTSLPFKCPAAPYEAALLIDAALRDHEVRDESVIDLYTPEPAPMPVAGPKLGRALAEILEERDIHYHPERRIERFDPASREVLFDGWPSAGFDLLAATPPHRPPPVILDSGLAGPSGWIPVDKETLETDFENVFAIGDVTAVTLPNGKLLPKAGVFAHAEAFVVADQIGARLERGRKSRFDGMGYCWVELGSGRAAFATGDFYAEPDPRVTLRRPGRGWHLGKILFERYSLGGRFERPLADLLLRAGARTLGIPMRL
jgi:sulfide:quinone oxidoreductase